MKSYKAKLTILTCLVITSCTSSSCIKPFSTDGCSEFPNGTRKHKDLWLQCCTEHDKAYWRGGTYEERLAADQTLRRCVDGVGEPKIAELMFKGVRVGGSPYWPTRFRWGYGWPYPRGYKPLTEDEKAAVQSMIGR